MFFCQAVLGRHFLCSSLRTRAAIDFALSSRFQIRANAEVDHQLQHVVSSRRCAARRSVAALLRHLKPTAD
jgi:hypothetical protein